MRSKEQLRAAFHCLDCRCDTHHEYYMVRSELWRQANPAVRGQLCIACLESRLGRSLVPADFLPLPVNTDPMPRSALLVARLSGTELPLS